MCAGVVGTGGVVGMGVCGCGGYRRCSEYGCVRVWWVREV